MPHTTTRISAIARVIVSVADQDRAIGFYAGTLGFDVVADVPFGDGERWVEVLPPGGGIPIALGRPMGEMPRGAATMISFRCDDIEALHAHLRAAGVDADEQILRPGDPAPPMFWFRDPDGNVLHVTEER